jgi:hypothetical protein
MDAMGDFVTEGLKSGVLKDTAGLKSTAEGFRVRSSGNQLKVTDGPFTESKEVVGGYALVEVASKEEALQVARQFMELHRVHWPAFDGECEVRPLEDMSPLPVTSFTALESHRLLGIPSSRPPHTTAAARGAAVAGSPATVRRWLEASKAGSTSPRPLTPPRAPAS